MTAVRRATAADTDALLSLWAVGRTPHAVTVDSAEAIAVVLARSAIFVVDGRDGLLGAVVAGWDGWRGNLYRLAVQPGDRRGGIGSVLVAEAQAWLVSQGATRISVLVAFEDAGARRFWTSAGFRVDEVIGRMVRDLESAP